MDVVEIGKALVMVKNALSVTRDAYNLGKDLKEPEKTQKVEDANRLVLEAEKQLAIAEAKIAEEMGYELCRCGFPPTIMHSDGHEWRCPKCNRHMIQSYGGVKGNY